MGAALNEQGIPEGHVLPTLEAAAPSHELKQVGSYEVTKPTGNDPSARLFLAKHTRLSRVVTLQELSLPDPKDVAGVAELVALARDSTRLRHPQIAEVTEYLEPTPGHFVCVMEPLFGETLRARINRGGVTVPDALEIICQLTEALTALHVAKRVHGALTASRVFLADGERGAIAVKLFDHGVGAAQARFLELEQRAPEQKAGGTTDALTDVYFLGSLISEMISGTEAIPAALQAVVAQARVANPAHRYRSVGVLCTAVIEALNPPYIDEAEKPLPPKQRTRPFALVALLLAVAGAGLYLKWPGAPPEAGERPVAVAPPPPPPKVALAKIAEPVVAAPVDPEFAPSLRPNMNLAISGALHQAVAKPVVVKKTRKRK